MTSDPRFNGTILWVAPDAETNREPLEASALEFKLALHFCQPGALFDRLRVTRPDLVGIELDADSRQTLALLKDLHKTVPRVTIFAASSDSSVTIIRAALEAGASEVVSLPLSAQELRKALIKFTETKGRPETTKVVAGDIITLCGARGGLGVTTLAVNLAARLAARGAGEVALVDLDLQRGDVCAFLNLTPLQSLATIAGAGSEVDEIFLHGTMIRHQSGVFVLPAPQQIEDADGVGHDEVAVALGLLRSQFRYTVVDTSRTITTAMLAGLEQADRVLLLTDLTVPGVRAAQRAVELFKRLNIPPQRVGLLVTETVPGPVALKDAVRTIGREPLLIIPRDEGAANDAMNAGAPLNGARHSGLSLAISKLAAKLGDVGVEPKAGRGHFLQRIFSKG